MKEVNCRMKKGLTLLLALCLALTMFAAATAEETPAAAPLLGGWQPTADATVTEETKTLLAKAFDGIGTDAIDPIAVLGTQVVAGTNTCILCRITPGGEDAAPYYALIYVNQDLEGNVSLMQIVEMDLAEMASDFNG